MGGGAVAVMAASVPEAADARGDERGHARSSHAAGLCNHRASLSEKLILQPALKREGREESSKDAEKNFAAFAFPPSHPLRLIFSSGKTRGFKVTGELFMDGLLIIDKPAGWTSHDVVARARRLLKEKRVGHTGTLDPFATGVLVLLVGRATRLAQFLAGAEKEYEATVRLGYATDTGDLTGARREGTNAEGINDDALTLDCASLE